MANNYLARDGNGTLFTKAATDLGSGVEADQVVPGDGTNWFLSGNAANMALLSSKIAQVMVPPGGWMATSAPAVNTQATASKAAGAAGTRHVCTGISMVLAQDATGGTPFAGTVNLRDGATGAGTILGTWFINIATTAYGWNHLEMTGLNVVGTAATAMTLEFTSAGGAHTLESCTLTGYDAPA